LLNLLTELGNDVRVVSELVEEPAEGAGGGVATGQQHGNELIA